MKKISLLYLLIFGFMLCGAVPKCDNGHTPPPALNNDDDDDNNDAGKVPGFLPGYSKGLSVVPFTDKLGDSECVGFYAVVDFERNPKLSFHPQLAWAKKPTAYYKDFTDGTPCIVTNGGYFGGSTSVSLLVENGLVKSPAARNETYNNVSYYIVRAALGLMEDGSFEAAWVYSMPDNTSYAFPSAWNNNDTNGTAASGPPVPTSPGAKKWQPEYAIGGGPMLVYEGKNVAVENTRKEVFSSLAGRNPRTAIGFTEDGKLILLVCDGRSKQGSVGYTFSELADRMIEIGCEYAINLDGGGSSVLVGKDGKVLNLPSDSVGTTLDAADLEIRERNVPTAIIIAETE